MKIAIIFANGFTTGKASPTMLRKVGNLWGDMDTHKAWATDNVVCVNNEAARLAINMGVHERCNFFINDTNFETVGKIKNVRYYSGTFPGEFSRPEEVISMNLAANYFDLVILLGFDLDESETQDQINYIAAVKAAVTQAPEVQWVAIPLRKNVSKVFDELDNFTVDNLDNVINLAKE